MRGVMKHLVVVALVVGPAVGCEPPQDGVNSLILTSDVKPGAECTYGGTRLDIGLDDDGDGRLNPFEIDQTQLICAQRVDGRSTAVKVTRIPAGGQCAAGGQRIESGIDDNDDGDLQASEVDGTAYVCAGVDGADGFDSAVRLVPIAPDLANALCPLGGTRIESGSDENRNGVLDDDEVNAFQSVCSIRMNEHLFLVDTRVELPGPNCANGGASMRFGLDDDGDNVLSASEASAPIYACNELELVAGKTGLIETGDASLAQCTFGGFVFRHGLDDNYDNVLQQSEVDGLRVVCNGNDGFSGLVDQESFVGAECGAGVYGLYVTSGLDLDYDGVLDSNEVTAEGIVCDGLEGPPGLPGPAALIVQEPAQYCDFGTRFSSGTDWDEDGYLDASEVDQVSEVCDGEQGHNALVEVYDASGECYPDYGVVVWIGTDWNDDGYLDSGERDEVLVCGAE